MESLSIHQAADATGWSPRMLRYLEQSGLVLPLRSPGGHRHYGPRQVERLTRLKGLLDEHGLGNTDLAFELRMRTDPALARAVDEWFGAVHRPAPGPGAGMYRRLATYSTPVPGPAHAPARPPVPRSEGLPVTRTLTPDSAGTVPAFKVADLS